MHHRDDAGNLLRQAYEGYHTDPAGAAAACLEALALLPEEATSRRALAHTILGSSRFVEGDLAGAEREAELAHALDDGSTPSLGGLGAHGLLGAIARRRGDLATAIAHQQRSLTIGLAGGYADEVAVTRNNLGLALSASGDLTGALEVFAAALQDLPVISPRMRRLLEGTLLNNIGLLHQRCGDLHAAVERFRDGFRVASSAGNPREALRIGRNLGPCLLQLGQAAEAAEVLEQVAQQASALGHDQTLLQGLSAVARGQAALARGEGPEGIELLYEGLDLLGTLGDDWEAADRVRIVTVLARALQAEGRELEALGVLRSAPDRRVDPGPARSALRLCEVDLLDALGRSGEALAVLRALRDEEDRSHRQALAEQAEGLRAQLEVQERLREAERLRTERERLSAMVAERTRDLEVARDRAEAGDRAKTAFLAVASHELRTPLHAITGYVEMVCEELDDSPVDAVRADLGRVLEAAAVLTHHVDRILAMANLEGGGHGVCLEDVSVAALLHDVQARHARGAALEGRRVEVEAEEGLHVRGDAALLVPLLDELVRNARTFSGADRAVRLRAERVGDRVRLEVVDRGVGIATDLLEQVRAPFGVPLEGWATRRHGGLGLGLSLCQRYAALLGTTLEAASTLGVGSTFRVTLPIAEGNAPVDGTGPVG